jgi:flagellar hook protein FlgE
MAISALNTGLSGLQASQRALDNSAHNIANANTQGFQPSQASFQENQPAGSGVTLSVQAQQRLASDQPSNTDLAKETTDTLLYKTQFVLSAKVIQTQDQNLGSLIDTKA